MSNNWQKFVCYLIVALSRNAHDLHPAACRFPCRIHFHIFTISQSISFIDKDAGAHGALLFSF